MLRDRLVCGVYNTKLKEKLMELVNPLYKTVVEKARYLEAKQMETNQINGNTIHGVTNKFVNNKYASRKITKHKFKTVFLLWSHTALCKCPALNNLRLV